ncbi:MAG: hypothetical protein A3H02_02180 [Candidatus Niyogibacteria bacterium RIFCSPLOWO2_12_FULL_41_13]|uniref:Putative 3-methyladenine DNA glycosylase n=1 Tax=Candidatus Niyogibacteria bacterium RIFCSPLOWO2_12_FULL_41_13 TaxID=1801726 RepID=A0A1G2F3V0_9BACT|nr:MAG: hypothetical protein A3H02_02180 [Candidatus Niyogibacteria bacterium RIFCSPLOWO2_12_FULL_41_13]
MKLKRDFFLQSTLKVAKNLLGKYLVRKYRGGKIVGKIVETEAYVGPKDKASHAYGGKQTARNRAEFLKGGHIYIYLVYGMHWQFNISTYKEGKPECVLIRAVEPVVNTKYKILNTRYLNKANGPGKLCGYFKFDKSFYGEDTVKSSRIWLEDGGEKIKPSQIAKGPRIGIDYAGPRWSKIHWRFWLKNSEFVSKFK